MWLYNLLGDNKENISDLLRLDTFIVGFALLTDNLVELKRENPYPILSVKIIDWRKIIDYFGESIEADPSRVGKKNLCIFHRRYITSPSSQKLHKSRYNM